MNTAGMLTLDQVMVDYIRFTVTGNERAGNAWHRAIIEKAMEDGATVRDDRFLQYIGLGTRPTEGGDYFGGIWEGDHETHYLVQASGAWSDMAARWLLSHKARWEARCKRLDLQITIEQPREWSQWGLMSRLKERGRNVSWTSSADTETRQELATIYIGSRLSERFTRVYQKLTSGGAYLLRFETEYKGKRADNMANVLARNPLKARDYLLHEIQAAKDDLLSACMEPCVVGAKPDSGRFAKTRTQLEKQGEWLRDGVLPAFDRYVNDHDHDPSIVDLFRRVLDNTRSKA